MRALPPSSVINVEYQFSELINMKKTITFLKIFCRGIYGPVLSIYDMLFRNDHIYVCVCVCMYVY